MSDSNKDKDTTKSKKREKTYLEQTSAKQVLLFLALAFLALFLVAGRFNIGGLLPVKLYELVALALGWLSFTAAPFLITYFAFLHFKKIKPEVILIRIMAGGFLLIVLAGCLHIYVEDFQAIDLAKQGEYGGYIGYGLASLLAKFLNDFFAFIVLLAIVLSLSLVIFDTHIKIIWQFLKGLIKKSEAPATDKQPAPTKKAFKLTENVPTQTDSKPKKSSTKPKEEAPAAVDSDNTWQFPPLDLLINKQDKADAGNVQANAEVIRETLANFNIDVEMEGANVGPRVTQYTLKPPSGIKLAKIVGLESNIALDLAASSIRMEAPIPGQKAVGIEVPNQKAATVRLFNLLESNRWQNINPRNLAFCIGQDIAGNTETAYLTSMPHVLLAGQTGSGKSVGINILLTSLLYGHSPNDLKLILVDPKQVELGPYNDIPHLLTPVITDPKKCISALKWAVAEMESRLKTFAKFSKRNISEYNNLKDQQSMPFIVIVIDELADLMMVASKDVETLIVRIAQKARAAGIHLVLATQRPSVNVITGLIKANIPARLAFTTASQVDSRTILDQAGAEKLLGSGDILFMHPSYPKPKRLQGAFITDGETQKICDFLRQQQEVEYNDEIVSQPVSISGAGVSVLSGGDDDEDDLFNEACQIVIENKKASTSLLQRQLRVGYARAARLVDTLEEKGIVGPADGSRPRDVLISDLSEIQSDAEDMSSEADDQPESDI